MTDKKSGQPGKIVKMFEEGRRFTEEVLEENKRLRLALEGQKSRIRRMEETHEKELPIFRQRAQLLEEENVLLKEELKDIKRQFNEIEKENWDFSERYLHVERQNSSLLNLYVASQRLHSTLSYKEALQIVMELVVNLVGSESFDICLYHQPSSELRRIAGLGTPSEVGESVEITDEMAAALSSGTIRVPRSSTNGQGAKGMVACVPLKLGGNVMGAIIIRELLAQKSGIEGIDHELFDLLGEHAVSALCASFLFTQAGLLTNSNDWLEAVESMSREAIDLENEDVEPTVIW